MISPRIATTPNRKAEAGLPRPLVKRQALIKLAFVITILLLLLLLLLLFIPVLYPLGARGAPRLPASNGKGAFKGAFFGALGAFVLCAYSRRNGPSQEIELGDFSFLSLEPPGWLPEGPTAARERNRALIGITHFRRGL